MTDEALPQRVQHLLMTHIDSLEKQTYADRRVSVITFIFSRPLTRVRGFADAFRKGRSEEPD